MSTKPRWDSIATDGTEKSYGWGQNVKIGPQTIVKTDLCYTNRVVLRIALRMQSFPASARARNGRWQFLPSCLIPQQRLASQSRLPTGNVGLVSRPGDFVGTDAAGTVCVSRGCMARDAPGATYRLPSNSGRYGGDRAGHWAPQIFVTGLKTFVRRERSITLRRA
jgi:hypothetical protein